MASAPLAAGDNLLQYRILERIGAGGMGVVWKALDTRLDREVALKLLPEEHVADMQRQHRFVREAKCVSALNHPNIITIFDINNDKGMHFIAMEYVRGSSLREVLKRRKLNRSEAISYAVQICDALASAHSAGVVHRDLNPGNIMITGGGLVKVLDFGLAKLRQPASSGASDGSLSLPGSVMGTRGYMSPEQVLGGEVDERSDVFSFGLVLYEMITGFPAFPRDHNPESVRKLLHEDPPPMRKLAPRTAAEIERIVVRCLRKDPGQRYANCLEAAADLRAAAAAQSVPLNAQPDAGVTEISDPSAELRSEPAVVRSTIINRRFIGIAAGAVIIALLAFWIHSRLKPVHRGIAVLPFTNVNADDRAQAFTLGLIMTLSAHLSGLESLQRTFWVVPAADVLQARVVSAKEAWQSFGVDLVISGSVERTGDRMRVTASLSDARNPRQLRSAQITTAAGDSFGLQDELMRVVSELLQVEAPPSARASIHSSSSTEPGAEDYYLQGRGYLQSRGDKADPAIEVFAEALKRDPRFVRAHAGLAEAYLQKYGGTKAPDWIEKARASSREALRLSSDDSEALITLGMVERAQGRYDEAIALFERVIAKAPRNQQAWTRLAQAYESRGRMDKAEEAYRRTIEIQPGYPGGYQDLGTFYYKRARYDDAERSFGRARDLSPDNYRVYNQLGAVYLQKGRYRQAETASKRSIALKPNAIAYNNLSSCYFYQERYAEALPHMEKALEFGQVSLALVANLARVYRLTPGYEAQAAKVSRQAFDLAGKQLSVNSRDAETRADLAWLYAETGDRAAAKREIQAASELAPESGFVLFRAVLVHELSGNRDRAFEAYRSLVKSGSYLEEVGRRPELKSFRSDQRFKEHTWQKPSK